MFNITSTNYNHICRFHWWRNVEYNSSENHQPQVFKVTHKIPHIKWNLSGDLKDLYQTGFYVQLRHPSHIRLAHCSLKCCLSVQLTRNYPNAPHGQPASTLYTLVDIMAITIRSCIDKINKAKIIDTRWLIDLCLKCNLKQYFNYIVTLILVTLHSVSNFLR